MIEAINILTFLIILLSGYLHFKKNNFEIWDPFLFVLIFAILYFVIGELYRVPADRFSYEVYLKSNYLILTASIGIYVGVFFASNYASERNIKHFSYDYKLIFLAAICASVVGYFFLFLYYERVGGIIEFLSMPDRVERNSLLKSMRGNFPYVNVLLASFILFILSGVAYFHKTKKRDFKRLILWPCLSIAPLIVFYILDGERSNIIKFTIIIVITYGIFFKLKISLRVIFLVSLVFVLMAIMGTFRGPLNLYFSGDHAHSIRYFNNIMENAPRSLIPNEFASIQSNLHYVVDKDFDKRYGDSYLQSLEYIIPRNFLPYPKRVTINDEISRKWGHELFGACTKKSCRDPNEFGVGMSQISESYINFGYLGVFIAYIVIGYYFSSLKRRLLNINVESFGFFLISSFIVLSIFRNSFAGIFSYLFYMYIFISIPIYTIKIYQKYFLKRFLSANK